MKEKKKRCIIVISAVTGEKYTEKKIRKKM